MPFEEVSCSILDYILLILKSSPSAPRHGKPFLDLSTHNYILCFVALIAFLRHFSRSVDTKRRQPIDDLGCPFDAGG